jgi:hypothetical protein
VLGRRRGLFDFPLYVSEYRPYQALLRECTLDAMLWYKDLTGCERLKVTELNCRTVKRRDLHGSIIFIFRHV